MGVIRHSVIEDAAEDLDATAENYRRTAASSAPEIRQRWLDGAERYERLAAAVRGAVDALRSIEDVLRDGGTRDTIAEIVRQYFEPSTTRGQ